VRCDLIADYKLAITVEDKYESKEEKYEAGGLVLGTTKSPWQLIKTLTTAQPAKRFSGNRKLRSGAKKSPSKMEARPKSPTSAHLGQIGGAGRLSAPTCRFPAIKARHLNFGLVPQLHLPLRNHNCHSGVIDYLSGLSARPSTFDGSSAVTFDP